MSLHIFANIVTGLGTAANNRGESDGNISTLQKLIWMGQPHSTVSAEAIRFAIRRQLGETNRQWDEQNGNNTWRDYEFSAWQRESGKTYVDDDLLGYMRAEAASEEGEASKHMRRGVLEVTRAVSLTPWPGDVTFSAASPGATPAASKGNDRGKNSVLFGTEVHATRYQYGIALTPERLRDKSRASHALTIIGALGPVAGNHGRFLFDFSPDSIVIRLTDDPAPRLLYCFVTPDDGSTVVAPSLFRRIEGGDIDAKELVIGGSFAADPAVRELAAKGAVVFPNGIRPAIAEAVSRVNIRLGVKG